MSVLGEAAKPILKKFSVVEIKENETKNSTWKTSCPTESKLAQRYIFRGEVRVEKICLGT